MQTKTKIIAGILALASAFTANANTEEFSVSKAPELQEKTENSITVTWEEVAGSLGYIVYYAETEINEETVDYSESPDLILENSYKISDLKTGTPYYIYVTALDEEGNETDRSPFLKETPEAELESFALESVEVLYSDEIIAKFNTVLDWAEDSARSFKLESTNGAEVAIKEVLLNDDKSLAIITEAPLSNSTEYRLVAVAVNDFNGRNIQAGVDGVKNFVTPTEFTQRPVVVEEVIEEEPVVEEIVEVNEEEAVLDALAETTDVKEIEVEKLPTTWAGEVMVLIAALLMTYLIFSRKRA